jgi:hypothetical protein
VIYLLLHTRAEFGSVAIWIIVFWLIFYMAVTAVFVWHIGTVLKQVLEEPDPERQRFLREVLRDLLEPFLRRRRR